MSDARTSRRDVLRLMAGAAGGLALGAGAAGCGRGRAEPGDVTRVSLDRVPFNERVRIDHHGEPVELLRTADGQVQALSLVCTHQYCQMFWHDADAGYRCPCHGATFSADGRPRSGPVTQPMWTLPARIEGREVVVGGR